MDETRVNNTVTLTLASITEPEPPKDACTTTNGKNGEASTDLSVADPTASLESSASTVRVDNSTTSNGSTTPRPTIVVIEEEDSELEGDDVIPGPLSPLQRPPSKPNLSSSFHRNNNVMDNSNESRSSLSNSRQIGMSMHTDVNMPAEEFAEGCKLLQAAALGNLKAIDVILKKQPKFVNFRDYDRRTALHVAASEGHLPLCKYLVDKGAKINRSDRWGGSPLDDATRHRHKELITYLRSLGAVPGSANKSTNFIKAAADGDYDEVEMLLMTGEINIDEGDYDMRTALHLAAGEGNDDVVDLLCNYHANVNVEDRWGNRPLDDAERANNTSSARILRKHGATSGRRGAYDLGDSSTRRREMANLEVKFDELVMVDRIGKGSFGEIYKCRWRGTLVAAKCIRTAKVQKEWAIKQALDQLEVGGDVDEAVKELDEAEMSDNAKAEALADFRQEISILKSLRHPNIVLLLAYSATENLEVMISELMKCSLLDIFKAHIVNGTKMKKKDQIVYATQLAQGMMYLHTCKPPIIHRDLKPANLLIDHSGVLKVADFGLSKVRPDPKKTDKDSFLMTGETGSYRFMAPEVFLHQNYTETVDVYSYGMILFYLLDGKPPWPYDSGMVAVKKASEEGDRPPIPRSWDSRLQVLLQECWDENPSSRPPFQQILQTLQLYSRSVFSNSENLQASHPDEASVSSFSKAIRCRCTIM
ncbi:serine/threonine protein kinase [Nitzschia inconspicua]|uniref:Serine/threonine protein kinase n=1 Tax=Nitzschia inconspicua TaxID=303405 RepID=A0A9K3KHF9_9STRA|nr:serine/threonine protein kinase [Nitzschia inconspicua]